MNATSAYLPTQPITTSTRTAVLIADSGSNAWRKNARTITALAAQIVSDAMTTNSDEERIAQIRRGYTHPKYYKSQMRTDIDFLLSLLDRQAAGDTGWLLEKMRDGNVHYICANYVLQWTDDPNKALRLARRADAEALTTIVEDCEKIAHHGWPATQSEINNTATRMREACVATLRQIAADYDNVAQPNNGASISKQAVLYAARQVESLTLDPVSGDPLYER